MFESLCQEEQLFNEQYPNKLCALCNLPERSALGQGEMLRFKVPVDVDVNKDSVGRNTAAGFAIDTKHVKTQVLVENGGTVVIGGICMLIAAAFTLAVKNDSASKSTGIT